MSELREFNVELRDTIVEAVRYIDKDLELLRDELNSANDVGFGPWDSGDEERRQQELNSIYCRRAKLSGERRAYEHIWRKVVREIELEDWLKQVHTWLPQGQARREPTRLGDRAEKSDGV